MTNIKGTLREKDREIKGRIVHFFHVTYPQHPETVGMGELPQFQVYCLFVGDEDGKITIEDPDHITVRAGALGDDRR